MNLYNALKYIHIRDKDVLLENTGEIWEKAAEIYEYMVYNGTKKMKNEYKYIRGEYVRVKLLIRIGWIPWQDYKWVERFKYEFTGREHQIEADAPGLIPEYKYNAKDKSKVRKNIYKKANIIYRNWLEQDKTEKPFNWRLIFKDTEIIEGGLSYNGQKRYGTTMIRLFMSGWIPEEDPSWVAINT